MILFDKFYENLPIRKVTICYSSLVKKENVQLNLFENNTTDNIENEDNINEVVAEIKSKYGKNSLLKATNLLKDSTAIERNKKIGGHYS